jgi:hypothetical protein
MIAFVANGRPLTPREYVYMAMEASQALAAGALENFRKPEYRESHAIISIVVRPIPTYLQYVALGIAAYWFYAVIILRAKEAVQSEMIEGLQECLEQLSFEGKQLSRAFAPDFPADMEAYLNAQIEDYDHPTDSHDPDICAVAKLHNEKMGKYYGPFIKEEDRLIVGTLIADVTAGLLAYMHDDLKLTLRQ